MDRDFWKYQQLLWKTTWNGFLEHFEGWKKLSEPLIVAVLTFLFSIIVLAISDGQVGMHDWLVISISTVGGPLAYVVFVLVAKRVFASYSVFAAQKGESDKILKEKEIQFDEALKEKDFELEKYNWDNVDFWVAPFSIIGKSGWVLKVENKKRYDISGIAAEITKIRQDEKNIPPSGLHLLGYIDRRKGQIGEKIVNSTKRGGIEAGKSKEFVVTSEVVKTRSAKTHRFETYPDNLSWDFPVERSNSMIDISRSLLSMANVYYGDNAPPEPTTVIEVCVRAEIKVEDDTIQLPATTINLQVMNNGSLSFYGEEDENDEDKNVIRIDTD